MSIWTALCGLFCSCEETPRAVITTDVMVLNSQTYFLLIGDFFMAKFLATDTIAVTVKVTDDAGNPAKLQNATFGVDREDMVDIDDHPMGNDEDSGIMRCLLVGKGIAGAATVTLAGDADLSDEGEVPFQLVGVLDLTGGMASKGEMTFEKYVAP